MSKKTLETKVVKLLPSSTLKEYLKEFDFHFTAKDILRFIEDYAPTFDEKLNLLNEAAATFSEKSEIKHAEKLIRYHIKTYKEFMTPNNNCVYEVEICCNPGDKEETYIVKTYSEAMTLIDNFLKYYRDVGVVDNKLSEYRIYKKTSFPPQKPYDFCNKVGEMGRCVLGYKRVIKSVEMHNNGSYLGRCKGNCSECKNECIDNHYPHFPPFLEKYDLVAYKDDWGYKAIAYDDGVCKSQSKNDGIVYGVLTTDMKKLDDDTHVVLLDNPYIRNRNAFYQDEEGFYRIYDEHDHPSYAKLFKPDLTKVDKSILADYEYAKESLKKLEKKD